MTTNLSLKQLQNRRWAAHDDMLNATNASDRAHAEIMLNAYQARIDLILADAVATIKRNNEIINRVG